MKKIENIKQYARYISIGIGIYSACYLAGRLITTIILYKDNIKSLMKRVCLKLACFFKRLQDKFRPTKVSEETKETLAEFIARAEKEGRCKVMSLDDLDEFDYSEE